MASDKAPNQAILRPPSIRRATTGSSLFGGNVADTPTAAIDDVDRALVRHLLADSRMSNRRLAQQVRISESAVSTRLRKLMDSGALVFTAVIDWEKAGFEWWVILLIKTRKRSAVDVASDIGGLAQCASTAVVLGSHDLIAYLLVRDRAELREVIDKLGSIDGVAELDVELATDTQVSALGRRLYLAMDPTPIRLPAPCIELDDLDLSILQALIDDGRQSSRNIARKFGVSEGTIRARISRMTESGLARVVAMVEPVAFGLAGVAAIIMLHAERARIDAIVKEFTAMPNVTFVAVCLGNWDLHVGVFAADAAELMEIVGSRVQAVDGVLAADTLLLVDIVRINPCLKRVSPFDSMV
ncbi:Lrp/AsnC family transcriptional regulator [Mycobacterium branderi]|uniref:HTH asnC-type domain-containing protein n=1 Tax=Mycobacterium branderi TaxID=43348 RepID=A0A7I7VZA1_9MYCO|nr:Lrp/AsnC family transcriptional regulator [Mycobacterium branderi]MCV7232962.1 Lrp/AsnC family transcriptional regulator [Mycobacterium branderi]ORA41075.1 hypothetical protein BST20_02765 [Mycobacterium branderi]BBZ10067.1 hypothetical protein MBRA_02620 [Mycobacterium branderi]